MKKLLALVVITFGAVVAQAVVYTWNDKVSNAFADENGKTIVAYTNLTKLVITVTYASSSASAFNQNYFAIRDKATGGSDGLFKMEIYEKKNESYGHYYLTDATGEEMVKADAASCFSQARNIDKGVTSTFTFEGLTEDGSFKTVSVSHKFADGETLTTSFTGSFDYNGCVLDELYVYDNASVSAASIEVEGTPSTLPEPGAMALLALGAGALALRRRIA